MKDGAQVMRPIGPETGHRPELLKGRHQAFSSERTTSSNSIVGGHDFTSAKDAFKQGYWIAGLLGRPVVYVEETMSRLC
jgi:hypothetical protein